MTPYRISIIIPVHNGMDYLPQAVQSVIDQKMDFRFFEVLLVDDGSTDGSAALVDSYSREHPNFRGFHFPQASGAAGKPRNFGLENASAPYVLFLDDDDALLPESCSVLFNEIEKSGDDVVSGYFRKVTPDDSFVPSFYSRSFPDVLSGQCIRDYPEFLIASPALASRLFKRRFLMESGIRFPEGIIAQDAVFVTEALLRAASIGSIPHVVYEYHIRADHPSVSRRLDLKYFQDFSESRRLILDLYDRCTDLDYFSIRYWMDIRFILAASTQGASSLGENLMRAFDPLRWFFSLHDRGFEQEVNPSLKAIACLVADGDYSRAVKLLRLIAEYDEARRKANIQGTHV